MDFKKFLPGADTKSTEEYFWALVIEPGWVQAGIWKLAENRAEVVHESPSFPWAVDGDLVNACDNALSSAFQDFPEGVAEPSKTVFGVSYSWVSEGEISPENLEKIKVICKELSLEPVGFVVLPEAVSHFTKSEEGTPLNAVIIGIYKEIIEVSLFELGKLTGTTVVARSVSVVEDLVEGLTRLNGSQTLPSRFLIYDGREADLEEAEQSLIKADWETYDMIKFLHTPKIEIFETSKKIQAVSLAGASEIANVSKLEKAVSVAQSAGSPEENTYDDLSSEATSAEELGFALEKDVNEMREDKSENPEKSGSFEERADESKADFRDLENVTPVEDIEASIGEEPAAKKQFVNLSAGGVGRKLLAPFSIVKKISFRMPKIHLGQSPIFLGLLFLLVLGIAGLVWWWFYPKAVVSIYVSSETLDQKAVVKVDSSRRESDLGEKILAASELTADVNGERTKETTGTKTVGDRAKGQITIYRVGTELDLPRGTILNGPQNLKFVTDSAVEIASGSASTPSATQVDVTAENFGAQYNLASGSTFTVSGYSSSDMEGKNESAFTGGSSREINAVSENDQTGLLEELTTELEEKAREKLSDQLSGDQLLIEGSYISEEVEDDFNHKVGDEADTLGLSLSLTGKALAVKNDELVSLAREVLNEKIPQGFILRDEQIEFEFSKVDDSDETNTYELRIKGNLLPQVNTEELEEKIKGRYPQIAQDYLNREVPGFVRAEIKINPALPGKLKTLPHVSKNIDVEVSAER